MKSRFWDSPPASPARTLAAPAPLIRRSISSWLRPCFRRPSDWAPWRSCGGAGRFTGRGRSRSAQTSRRFQPRGQTEKTIRLRSVSVSPERGGLGEQFASRSAIHVRKTHSLVDLSRGPYPPCLPPSERACVVGASLVGRRSSQRTRGGGLTCGGKKCAACSRASGDRLRRDRGRNPARRMRARASGPRCMRESGRRSVAPVPSDPSARRVSGTRRHTRRTKRVAKALRQRQSRTFGRDRAFLFQLRRRGEREHPRSSLRPGDPCADAPRAEPLLCRLRGTTPPRTLKRGAMKRRWLVRLARGEERVEADEVEIMASGVLVFYRFQSRRESERTLLLALSPTLWRRCQLESDV